MSAREILRGKRAEAGMTQRAVADRAGVPQSTVARVESGALTPRVDTYERILTALDLTISVRPVYGRGVDRSLIRRMLLLDPAERIVYAAAAGNAIETLRRQVKATGV